MNADRKKRIAHEISNWKNACNCRAVQLTGDRMAALLQELVDAPEPEPVAYVTGYNNGYPTIAPINSALCMAIGTALYSAPPSPSVPDVLPATNPSQISSFTEPVEWLPGGFRIEHFTKDDPMLTDEANAERRFFVTRIESPYPKDGVWFGATAGAALAKACAALGIEYAAPPAPDQSEQPLEMVPASAAQQIIADALSPCAEIDATTRAIADQAEQAYEILAAALGKTPHDLCGCDLVDLANEAAGQLDEWLPAPDVAQLSIANQAMNDRMTAVIDELRKAPAPFAAAIGNDRYLIGNVAAIVTELTGEKQIVRYLQQTIVGLHNLLDQIRHTLDLSPAASSMDILAEIENLSRLAEVTLKPVWSDAA